MGTFNVGRLWDGGCGYDCTISYDTVTRTGDYVKIKNVKATITHAAGSQTRNRLAVTLDINGVNKAYNIELKRANPYDEYWPSSAEATLINSTGYEFYCLGTSFPIGVTFKSTGYGSSWDSDYGHVSTYDWDYTPTIGCPARTYPVTFNANGGSGAPSSQSKIYNTTLTLSSTIPTYAGFAFKGWSGSDGNTYQAGGSYTSNANLDLTAIWQALTTDLDDVDDIEAGENPTFSWTPQASNLTYKLVLSLGEWTYTSGAISPGSTSKYTYNSYTVPLTVCEQLPTQTEGLMQVDLETYSGSTKTGTSTKYFKVSVPDSVVPAISNLSITDGSENALNVFLQNFSWVKAEMDVDGAYGSTVSSVTLTVGDEVISEEPEESSVTLISEFLENPGTVSVSVEVIDSRGRTATSSSTITVHEYERPSADVSVVYRKATQMIETNAFPSFSSVGGLNSATIKINNGAEQEVLPYTGYMEMHSSAYGESRNYTSNVKVTDAVTFSITVASLHPGRGDRFQELDEDQIYIGMDDKGWKDIESSYDGGVRENGTIWFERYSGHGPLGIGFPMLLDPDTDYELLYSADNADDDTVALIAFFNEVSGQSRELATTYISTTDNLAPGQIFHSPEGTTWGVLVLGVDPASYEITPIGHREFTDVIIRKIEHAEETLVWEMETGTLGLDTPNQKYVSRIQMRIDYIGTMRVEVMYDNEGVWRAVHESESQFMRSITVPIKVKRHDHFRIRLSGTGQARLYSFGYETDEGSGRCLI